MNNRKDHWEKVYENKSPLELSWYQKTPSLSLKLIENAKLKKDAAIIDVGGGASLLVDHLYERGYRNLAILDISRRALEHAKQRLGDSATTISWFEADVTDFVSPSQFDLWHDRAVFHFLTDEHDRKRYVETLLRTLNPGAQVIIATFALNGPEKCSGLPIVQYDATKLKNELGQSFKLLEQAQEVHVTPTGKEQAFGFHRFHYQATS